MTPEKALAELDATLKRILDGMKQENADKQPQPTEAVKPRMTPHDTLMAVRKIALESGHPLIVFMDDGEAILHGSNEAGRSAEFLADSIKGVMRNACPECQLAIVNAVLEGATL